VPPILAPAASADPTDLADWLELIAVTTLDSNSSRHDLMTAIRRSGTIDAARIADAADDARPLDEAVEQEADELEVLADAAFAQLEIRATYLGPDYPFTVGNGVLTANEHAVASPYVFLSALTQFGLKIPNAPESGAELFELVSADALVQHLGGAPAVRSYDFGSPRRSTAKSFHAAIEDLCLSMGEGRGCKVAKPLTATVRDAKLDIVAWVPFGDGRSNQVSVFGQCATGRNWPGKVNELQPVDFCRMWLQEPPAMSPLLAFFVPMHLEDDDWMAAAIGERRLLFDRLRIAKSLAGLRANLSARCAAWTAAAVA